MLIAREASVLLHAYCRVGSKPILSWVADTILEGCGGRMAADYFDRQGDAAGFHFEFPRLRLQFLLCAGPIFEGYGGRMAADDFDRQGGAAGFALEMGIKDVGHMRTLADEHRVDHTDTET